MLVQQQSWRWEGENRVAVRVAVWGRRNFGVPRVRACLAGWHCLPVPDVHLSFHHSIVQCCHYSDLGNLSSKAPTTHHGTEGAMELMWQL